MSEKSTPKITTTGVPLPPIPQPSYNEKYSGFWGELGVGRHTVRYVMSCVNISELDKLTLVSEIPDSQKWPIRQLFQRNIDEERVNTDLVKYFKGLNQLKFFNPLTIVLLPIEPSGKPLPDFKEEISESDLNGAKYTIYESTPIYKLSECTNYPQISSIEWNSARAKAVAVDGQHRLSALKKIAAEYKSNTDNHIFKSIGFGDWKVPVVLVSFPPGAEHHPPLENMRSIFVTINKTAKAPNRCRNIILDDTSFTSICCQELLDYCHSNSASPLPIMFFDWLAKEEVRKMDVENPHAFMRVEELEDIHINYLTQENSKDGSVTLEQRKSIFLEADGGVKDLQKEIRAKYRENLMPAILYILSEFTPFKQYVQALNEQRKDAEKTGGIKLHAWDFITYGAHNSKEQESKIKQQVVDFEELLENKKNQIAPAIFKELIGARGVFYGFHQFREVYNEVEQTESKWMDVAKIYLAFLNNAVVKNAFDPAFLRHIAIDHNEQTVNYRHDDQEGGLGSYCALIALSGMAKKKSAYGTHASVCLEEIEDELFKGFKKEVRPAIKEKFPALPKDKLDAKIDEKAEKKTQPQMEKLREQLEKL